MMVMMIAITASLNASRRPVPISPWAARIGTGLSIGGDRLALSCHALITVARIQPTPSSRLKDGLYRRLGSDGDTHACGLLYAVVQMPCRYGLRVGCARACSQVAAGAERVFSAERP